MSIFIVVVGCSGVGGRLAGCSVQSVRVGSRVEVYFHVLPRVLNTLDRLEVLIDWRQVCGMSSTPLLRVYLAVSRFERVKTFTQSGYDSVSALAEEVQLRFCS